MDQIKDDIVFTQTVPKTLWCNPIKGFWYTKTSWLGQIGGWSVFLQIGASQHVFGVFYPVPKHQKGACIWLPHTKLEINQPPGQMSKI
jgi:hypothetical protein